MTQPATEVLSTTADSLIVTADTGFALADFGIVLVVIIGAAAYLYHRYWRKRNPCGGDCCSGKDGSCASSGETQVPADSIGGRRASNG